MTALFQPSTVSASPAGWHGELRLHYQRSSHRTVARFQHNGPLRVLQSLYPEGDDVCHNVLVHPPGGLVGGDVLDIHVQLDAGTHGLITTPGATRFYRTTQAKSLATQKVYAQVGDHARMEWLPLETIAYNDCLGLNQAVFDLAPTAELMAWDITALGLPNANQPFERGQLQQHMEIRGVWLERGLIDALDAHLLNGPLGLAGHRCMATLVLATGGDMPRDTREHALELACEMAASPCERVIAGVTAAHSRVIVVRALAPQVEPVQTLLRAIWASWRRNLWQMADQSPRIWST